VRFSCPQAVAGHFSQLAASLYMVLRLDAVLACFCFLHRLPASFARAVHANAAPAAAPAVGPSPPRPRLSESAALAEGGRPAADG
jgi:hypothetical protein